MLAETAQLAVNLTLGGNFSSGLSQAEANLTRFGATAETSSARTGVLSGAFGRVGVAAGAVGGALSHAGNQIKNLVTGPLGMIGLAGGLLSVGGAISQTLGKMNDLAFGTEKLTALTGDSAEAMSTLLASAEKYGITLDKLTTVAGFYEKTVGKLGDATTKTATATKSAALASLEYQKLELEAAGKSTKHVDALIKEQKAYDALHPALNAAADGLTKLQALEKQFGVTLTDSTGKALPFSEALLNVADTFAKSTDEAQKAYLASILFGRGYTALVPILDLGRQGILDLEKQAASMGLQLSEDNVADFAKYREAIRGSQEAISGLEVAIGEQLLPVITDAAKAVQAFVTSNKGDIVSFFQNAAAMARTVAGALGDFARTAASAWNMIPAPMRDLLVKGIAGDRVFKFLFGFDPVKAIGSALFGGSGLGGIFARGSSPANPMWVASDNAFAGGQLTTMLSRLGMLAGAVAILAEIKGGIDILNGIKNAATPKDALHAAAPLFQGPNGPISAGITSIIGDPIGDFLKSTFGITVGYRPQDNPNYRSPELVAALNQAKTEDAALDQTMHGVASGNLLLTAALGHAAKAFTQADWLKKLEAEWRQRDQSYLGKVLAAEANLRAGRNVGTSAAYLAAHPGGYDRAIQDLSFLKSLNTRDPSVVAAIHTLERRLPDLKISRDDMTRAVEIAQDADPKNTKLAALNRIMADLKAHGDPATRAKVQNLIDAVKHQKTTVNVSVPVTVRISGALARAYFSSKMTNPNLL